MKRKSHHQTLSTLAKRSPNSSQTCCGGGGTRFNDVDEPAADGTGNWRGRCRPPRRRRRRRLRFLWHTIQNVTMAIMVTINRPTHKIV